MPPRPAASAVLAMLLGSVPLTAADRQPDPTSLAPDLLAPVRHATRGIRTWSIRAEETAVYYRVLAHARDVDHSLQQASARRFLARRRDQAASAKVRAGSVDEFPLFVDLYRQVERPGAYHGKLITLTGHIRKLIRVPAGANDEAIETVYEAWLYTANSQHHPAVIITTSVPAELLREVERLKSRNRPVVIEGISATGYFFKMYGYQAHDAPRFAPLVLGQRLEWHPPTVDAGWQRVPAIVLAVLGSLTLPVIWMAWRSAREDRTRRRRRQQELADQFEALPD